MQNRWGYAGSFGGVAVALRKARELGHQTRVIHQSFCLYRTMCLVIGWEDICGDV